MIEEAYVSFETAKLLKEKGFDEQTVRCYNLKKELCACQYIGNETINSTPNYLIAAPTLQMAMKWLLKKYNIFICVLFLEESNGFGYTIENIVKKEYITTSKNSSYKEIENACEEAIKYCLDLI
jgi:hypothetical protein